MARRATIGMGEYMNERTNRNGKEPFLSNAASRRHRAGVRKRARPSAPSRCPPRAPAATGTEDRHQPLPRARQAHRHGRIRRRPSKPHQPRSVQMVGELLSAARPGPPLPNGGVPNGYKPIGPEPTPPPWRPRGHAPGRHWRPPLRLSRPTDTVPQRTPRRIADCEGPPCTR